ncbi:MAG: VCBS repeat-containing protein [Pirellulaceae bacterium]
MSRVFCLPLLIAFVTLSMANRCCLHGQSLERLPYNNPGLTVDLGVGLWAWPLPIDFDNDGDLDLVVSCPDKPYSGTYFFENPGDGSDQSSLPIFKPARSIGSALRNVSISYPNGKPRVLVPGHELTKFTAGDLTTKDKVDPSTTFSPDGRSRANQWTYVDYDGDDVLDLVVGHGLWNDYGWDDAFNAKGEWTRGPLHGFVFLLRNRGTNDQPKYNEPVKIEAGERPVDVFGMPSPQFADFDGDDDLDLMCGEFLDGFTFFENIGTRQQPQYAEGRRLLDASKHPVAMDLQMITPTAIDWDRDGDVDLICGDEDGRVAFIEHTGTFADRMPIFAQPVYFQQQAADVKFGALVTPVGVDWDGDGDHDIVAGNTAGYIAFIENLGIPNGKETPRWAAPKRLRAGDETLRIQAGINGSIQGPAEAKWGYTTLSVADWDHDGLLDLIVNSIWGKVVWYRNVGTVENPKLAAAKPIRVQWEGPAPKPAWNWWDPRNNELATQWRTTPLVADWDNDGLNDLIMLDHEGFLALYRRRKSSGELQVLPGERVFWNGSQPLRLNEKRAGGSGRRKLCIVDLDNDGRRDLLVNSVNVEFWRNVSSDEDEVAGRHVFRNMGNLSSRQLAGHTTSPTTADLDGDGHLEVVVGAEDGFLYAMSNPLTQSLATGGLEVSGTGFHIKPLKEGERAFSNRDYVWLNLPERLSNWRYTQVGGGLEALLHVRAIQPTDVFMATAASKRGLETEGWKQVEAGRFQYSDKGKTSMQVYRKSLRDGEAIAIPQGTWTGGLLLLPPEE